MEINWSIIAIVVVVAAALIILLIRRNQKDKNQMEKDLNAPEKKDESESNDENDNV